MDVSKLRERLLAHGQEHLLHHWDRLDEDGKARLYKDLDQIDYSKMATTFKKAMQSGEK